MLGLILKASVSLAAIYILPGFLLAQLFTSRLRKDFFAFLLFSYFLNPIFYSLLALFDKVTFYHWLLTLLFFSVSVAFFVKKKIVYSLELSLFDRRDKQDRIIFLVLFFFFIALSYTKLGIFLKRTPIVFDDYPHLSRVVSLATSAGRPKHFNFPTESLSYYFGGVVSPALLTRFTGNFIKVNRSFAFNFWMQTAVSLWLVFIFAKNFYKSFKSRLFFSLSTTIFGGFEFLVSLFSGQKNLFLTHLEGWPGTSIFSRMPQISSFATTYIWASHHLFAALNLLFLYLLIFKGKGNSVLKSFLLALVISCGITFSFFSGAAVMVSLLLFLTYKFLILKEDSFKNVFLTLLITLILLVPTLLIVGVRSSSFRFALSLPTVFGGEGAFFKGLNLTFGIPLFYFLELGVLSLGILYIANQIKAKKPFFEESFVFFIIPLIPLFLISLVEFPEVNDFVARSRSITPSLVALAVMTGLYFKEVSQKRLFSLAIFSILTTLSPISEIYQNSVKTPPVSAWLIYADSQLPLKSIVFSQNEDTFPKWQISVFLHRMTVKANYQLDQVDFQYTGLEDLPKDGLLADTYEEITDYLKKHPTLEENYKIYYISKEELDLAVVQEEFGKKLYNLN